MNSHRASSDSGFSLVELAVYIVILGIISTIIAATMVSLFRSESTVSGLTTSASDAQNAETLLRGDIRNAREFRVTDFGSTVTASVAGKSSALSWNCVRWQVVGAGNDRTLQRSQREDLAGKTWPAQATSLLSGVAPMSGSALFSGGTAFGAVGQLNYSWKVATAEEGFISVVGESRNRVQGDVTLPATTCF